LSSFSLTLTDAAISVLKEKLAKAMQPLVRIGVSGSGCSGFTHIIRFEDKARLSDYQLNIDGLQIIVDPKSAEILDGTTIDVRKELMSQGFKFINTDKIASTCGCGKSFTTKEDK
jgi:iron-sulfur cluster assembly protein